MPKVLVIYASMTGNTEEAMHSVVEGVKSAPEGIEVDVTDVIYADLAKFQMYDGILFGSYTWGDGDLPDEFLDLYENMAEADLSGKCVAVFGTGDTAYEKYNAAVDILIDRAKERGALVVLEGLKLENCPSDGDKEVCRSWGRSFAQELVSVHSN